MEVVHHYRRRNFLMMMSHLTLAQCTMFLFFITSLQYFQAARHFRMSYVKTKRTIPQIVVTFSEKLNFIYFYFNNNLNSLSQQVFASICRPAVRQSLGSLHVVIRQSSDTRLTIVGQSLDSRQVVPGQSSSSHRQSSGSHGAVVRHALTWQLQGSCWAVVRQLSGTHPAVVWQSSSSQGQSLVSHWVVLRKL